MYRKIKITIIMTQDLSYKSEYYISVLVKSIGLPEYTGLRSWVYSGSKSFSRLEMRVLVSWAAQNIL